MSSGVAAIVAPRRFARARNVALVSSPGASVPKPAPEPSEPAFTTGGATSVPKPGLVG